MYPDFKKILRKIDNNTLGGFHMHVPKSIKTIPTPSISPIMVFNKNTEFDTKGKLNLSSRIYL